MITFGNASIESDEVINFLKKKIRLKETLGNLIQQKIVNQAAQERGITVTAAEIQGEAECFRLEMHLEKAADTFAWLEEQMITADDWEAGIFDRLLTKKLAEHLFADQVESYFAQNRSNYEQILLYQIIVPYEPVAFELFYQIEEQEISFYEAAHLYDIDEKRRYYCGCEGKIYRWSLEPDIATAVFSAKPGEVVAPIKTEQGYHLFKVEEFIAAQLTPEVSNEIMQSLFEEWLESELNYLLYN